MELCQIITIIGAILIGILFLKLTKDWLEIEIKGLFKETKEPEKAKKKEDVLFNFKITFPKGAGSIKGKLPIEKAKKVIEVISEGLFSIKI